MSKLFLSLAHLNVGFSSLGSRVFFRTYRHVPRVTELQCVVNFSQKRWKSKGKVKPKCSSMQPSKEQLPQELLQFIKEEDMCKQFDAILTRFYTAMQQKLALKLTPQTFAELPVPEAHIKLGQIANFVIQQQSRSSTGAASTAGEQTLLIDLAGRPDLASAARKAVSQFLESTKGGTGGTQLQSAGPSAFTVRLRTVVTRETREGLIQQGHEMLNQVKREMDRIYQTHDKLIHANADARKRFSEDNLFLARDYLRAVVKQQHAMATSMWESKEIELKAD
ncbi:Ribosome recycling factor [Paragonimus skrjabini miyazakii]|uniref:Ribosome-recycling factor, mitochondrial n=1 Tax=Paragonimus skrjabini miyazakii TaxID=59628 RepID=A0A8S9YJN0_9TREM|nr:Ribosome recycling factor [Paragonimus skrjabini miyazakii]